MLKEIVLNDGGKVITTEAEALCTAVHGVVIEEHKIKNITEAEKKICDWCFGRHDNHGISEIGYAIFEHEPIRKEWIDEAEPVYLNHQKAKENVSKITDERGKK